jgi:hypothetical protein
LSTTYSYVPNTDLEEHLVSLVHLEVDNTEYSPHLCRHGQRAQTLDRMFLLISVMGDERKPIDTFQIFTYRYLVVLPKYGPECRDGED